MGIYETSSIYKNNTLCSLRSVQVVAEATLWSVLTQFVHQDTLASLSKIVWGATKNTSFKVESGNNNKSSSIDSLLRLDTDT